MGVKDRALVDDPTIKRAGISGVIHPSEKNVQVIVGPSVQFMFDEVNHQLRTGSASVATAPAKPSEDSLPSEKIGTDVELRAPFEGTVVPLSEVPDESFAQGMVGEGFAVIPTEIDAFDVCAPVDGTITMVFKTGHAFGMRTEEGLDLLIHIGIDTVELKGEGFTKLAAKGDVVRAGTPIIAVESEKLRERGINLITPVVCPTGKQIAGVDIEHEGRADQSVSVARVRPAEH